LIYIEETEIEEKINIAFNNALNINPETSIAKEITIASGAVVIKNLGQPGIYAGNPARIFKLALD
jgi:acetyltransferase-like isoleucine patch superfamily enzyme